MAQLYVKPGPGRRPRHEHTRQPLPVDGDYWPDSVYTRRRLRDGDVVLATAPAPAPQPAPAKTARGKRSTQKQG